MKRFRQKHSRMFTRLGMALLVCFAASVLLVPVLHAQMTASADVNDAGFVVIQSIDGQHHGHSHDDELDDGTTNQFDGHNPMDHSHDVPAVFAVSAHQVSTPDRTTVLAYNGSFVVGTIFEIDRPPRL